MDGATIAKVAATISLFFAGNLVTWVENLPEVVKCPIFRAVLDTWSHGMIELFTWSIIDDHPWKPSCKMFSVWLISMAIDIDHFIAARTLDPNKAIHAPYRGIFHCTGMMTLASLFIYPTHAEYSFLFLTSFIPHHLLDGTRRGLYLWPLPIINTPPIPMSLVQLSLAMFPWVMRSIKGSFVTLVKIPKQVPYSTV